MNASRKFQFTGFCFALLATSINANVAIGQESFRLSRPTSTVNLQPPQIPKAAPLKAKATVSTEEPQDGRYHNAIFDWERKNLQVVYEEPDPLVTPPPAPVPPPTFVPASAMMAPPMQHHHGLKAHLGMAVIGLGAIAGTAAGAYLGATPTHHAHASYTPPPYIAPTLPPPPPAQPQGPTIEITAGHCPAAFDPEFQVPVRWWDALSKEEADPDLGPQWKLWMNAVKKVFQSRAYELRSTSGVSSMHIMINPDGSIFNMSPYTGAERGHPGSPLTQASMAALDQVISQVGNFPPFPKGSKVRCYHLIFSGSANI